MKRNARITRLVLILTLLIFGATIVPAQQQKSKKAQPKTVADYYMMLPQKHLNILKHYKNRRRAIETLDVKNGYLEVKSKLWDGETEDAEIALFRRKNGAAVIAVNEGGCGMGGCYSGLSLLVCDEGKWTDVTETAIPTITGQNYR